MNRERVAAGEVWAEQVRSAQAQIERVREVEEPSDLYRPWAKRFAVDPWRSDDQALSVLLTMARPDAVWLDLGAGGGRYALPLALAVRRVIAVEPSAAMLEVLRQGLAEHDIGNVEIVEDSWPTSLPIIADVALVAHVGYDIEDFGAFLDAAQAVARRIVVIMRTSGAARINELLWPEIHGQPRQAYPMLTELLELLEARGIDPDVTYVGRGMWAYDSREQLLAAARRLLYVRHGSAKDQALGRLVMARATERQGKWEIDWTPMQDGVVTWELTT